MAQKDEDHSAASCQICGMQMTLVVVEPRVASFAELHTFRCFACGEVRAIEQEKTHAVQAAAWPRSGFFH
jgi:uncharacterized Zn finger protein